MRDLDNFIVSLADNSVRAEIIAALARRYVERIGRILLFLHHRSPAAGATDADRKLYSLLDERLRSRGEW
jgi:hypothetical protein